MAPHKIPAATFESTIENVHLRSGHGDMYAIRNASSMAAHVAHLQSHNLVDDKMAIELLKPFAKCVYSPEYLATHPDYTGVQPEMPTIVTADRHRVKRDKELEQFVEDFEAGRIDEWGNPITQEADAKVEEPGVEHHDPESVNETTDNKGSNSGSSQLTDLSQIEEWLDMLALSTPTASSPEPAPAPAFTPSASKTLAMRQKSWTKKPKVAVEPLTPSPKARDYSEFKYGELVAECRRRKIMGGGNTQAVRNHLIQDEINILQGLPRNTIRHQGKSRKVYKHDAPAALQMSPRN